MKKREQTSFPATGGSSLLVIFAVLCLVVFALLSLSTVLAQKRLSEATARATAEWYAADLQAQEIFAKLRTGEQVPGVERTEEGYTYSVPVSQHQTLQVQLVKTDEGWDILTWQTVSHPEYGNETLPVWQGLD